MPLGLGKQICLTDTMTTLNETLLNDTDRPSVVSDCVDLIDAEVASKKGIGGLAIKTAFKTVKAIKPGIIPDAVNFLLDDFVEKLEPFYGEFKKSGEADLAGTSYVMQTRSPMRSWESPTVGRKRADIKHW